MAMAKFRGRPMDGIGRGVDNVTQPENGMEPLPGVDSPINPEGPHPAEVDPVTNENKEDEKENSEGDDEIKGEGRGENEHDKSRRGA